MRRFLVFAVLVVVVFGVVGVPAARAQEPEPTTTSAPPAPDIIPEPGEGVAPDDAGDRGGALQTVLFLVIVGGVVTIGALVVRQSRRARADRGF